MLSAEQIEDIKAQAYCCKPSKLANICSIYPLTMGEIIEMGVTKYNGQLGILLLTETEISEIIKTKTGKEIPIEEINPLEYLI